MRLLCAAAVSIGLGMFVVYAGDNKLEGSEKLAALKKKFDSERADLQDRFKRAVDPAERRGLQVELKELVAITADKALAIAKSDPKGDTGFAAAEFLVTAAAETEATGLTEVDAVLALLAEHHAANPKVRDLLTAVMPLGAAGDKLLVAVSEKATDKEARATALFIRGFKAARNAEEEEDDKELAAGIARATALLEAAAKESPDTKVGSKGKTVGELAKVNIEGLKEIVIVAVGKPAPDVGSLALDGKKVKLSDYKGKVVLLDVWATWCPPCRAMIPHERELVKSNKDKPFVLVSVSIDDKKDTLEKFLEKEPMPWVHWWDEGGESPVLKKYRVRVYPTLFLIDHAGIVREKWAGKPDDEAIDRAVDAAVKEAVKAKG